MELEAQGKLDNRRTYLLCKKIIYNNDHLCILLYMTFDRLVQQLGHLPFFDLSMVLQVSGENKSKVRTQLHRWVKSGKIEPLRREMYTLADTYRKTVLYPAVIANELYRPSYLSGLWALSYYGIIPEKVAFYTSITPRVPRDFTNKFGTFQYSNIKQSNFFGFSSHVIQQQDIWLADPEKAILDLFHLNKGEWTIERLSSMRFQNFDTVDYERLEEYAGKFNSPRIVHAVKNWNILVETGKTGEIEL